MLDRTRVRQLIYAVAFASSLAGCACASSALSGSTPGQTVGPTAATTPVALVTPSVSALPPGVAPRPANASIKIASPEPGETVSAGTVTVSVGYSGPPLVPAASATKLDDYHLHYFLDVDPTPYIGTTIPIPLDNPRILHSAATRLSFENVEPGTHALAVVMTGSDHISVSPPVYDQYTFIAA